MNNKESTGASKWALIGLFSLVAFMMVVGGGWFYRQETQTIQNRSYDNLKAVVDLKVNQIVLWRTERIGDARLNSSSPFLRSNIINWIKTPDNSSLKKDILERLKLVKEAYGYEDVILADRKGHILLNFHPQPTVLETETRLLVARTIAARDVVFGDFFRCQDCKQVLLDVAAPIFDQTGKPIVVLILRIDPDQYLYPLIQTWPTASKSAETLLVRKEGNDILFLNVLRHRADPALTLRIPMSQADVPAVAAGFGKAGLFEGRDYRGVKVLADIRSIPNSSWFMVAKVDMDEILSEVAGQARLIGFLTVVLVLLSGVATAFVYKRQGKRTFQALYRSERERANMLEQARVTLYSIGDAVITTGADGRVKQMNPVAEQLTGWKEVEAMGKPLFQVFHIVNEETWTEVENPVARIMRDGVIVGLANHTLLIAQDGTERSIADSGAPIRNETGEIIGVVLVFRDQTEERKNLAALQESMKEKAFLGDLIEQSSQPLGVGLPDGRLGLVNSAFCNLVGYSQEEMKSIDWATVLTPPEWLESERRKLEELRKTGRPVHYKKEYIRKDGSRVPIELLVHLAKDEKGQPEYYYAFVTDITERKRAQEGLQALTARQEALLSAIPDIIMEVDENKVYTWANQAGYEFFGGDVLGKEAAFYFEGEQKTFDIVQPLFNGDENVIYVESWQRRKDGEKRLLAWWCRVLKDESGKVKGSLSSARDITDEKQAEEELKRSEEKYRLIVENSRDLIFMLNPQLEFIYLSPAISWMMGYETSELLGCPFMSVVHPDDVAVCKETLRLNIEDGLRRSGVEYRVRHATGEWLWHTSSGVAVRDDHGKLLYFLGNARDITSRRHIEEQLRQIEKLESVGRLAAGVAHDFNNLLTGILGNAELALMGAGKEGDLFERLEEIKKAGEKAAGLTRQLLAFSRKQVFHPEVFDLNKVVIDIEKILRRLISEDVELKTLLTPDLGLIEADVGQIEQVIMNLVVNARDAMHGGGKLTIETTNTDLDAEYAARHVGVAPGPYVMLSLSDNGIGIIPEVQALIFDPFFTTKEKGKGTGLGLSTVYGIVKQCQGNIWVYSEVGKGTTFKIYLPRVDKAVEEEKSEVVRGEARGGSETILVVEDEESVRDLVVKVLKRFGYEVLMAKDGQEALELFERYEDPVHLLLTDVVMPRMNGKELAERLEGLHPEMKVIFMSGYTDNAIVHHGILDEGVAFIQKPFTPENLARKVREVLEG